MEEKNSFERIYEVIWQIPRGRVASYGQIATLAVNSRWAWVVGYALHAVPHGSGLPCHRVVTKDGRVSRAFGRENCSSQTELLKAEGIGFVDDCVDMGKYQWKKTVF